MFGSRYDMNPLYCRLELTDLEPEETAQISFHADTTGLRSTIMEFGRLDVGGRGLQKAFAAAHTPSASLPKPFEEYDDAEHHVLYKTLEEINRGKTESTSIQVNIPKLAMKPEEWLIAPAPSRDTKPVTKSDKLAFPTLSTDMSDWVLAGRSADQGTDKGRKPLLTRNRSIQDWLLQIKHFPHTQDEEEEYDFVEHVTISEASDSGMDIPTSLSSPVVVTSSNSVSPAQVTPTTMTTWLVSDSATQPSPAVKEVPAFSHMFKHNQGDIKEWLINSGGSSRSGSQSPEPVEIENLACMLDRTIFLHKADDKTVWLVGGRNNSRVPPITVVCKANEPCLRHGECVSSPPCGVEYLSSPSPSQGENIWLLNSTGPWEDTSQKHRFFYNHNMPDNYADWLYSSKQPDTILSSSGEKLDAGVFASWSASVSNKTSDWLKNCDPRGASPLTSIDNKDCIPSPFSCDIGAWLLKDSGGQENTYVPFSEVFKALSPANLSNWITRYEEGDHTMQVDQDVDSESEKRDTTSEKLEMAKWLLDGVRDSPGPTCPVSVTKNSGLGLWLFDKQLEW